MFVISCYASPTARAKPQAQTALSIGARHKTASGKFILSPFHLEIARDDLLLLVAHMLDAYTSRVI